MFFKIFPIKIYTLLHTFEPIVEALLPLCLRYLQNMYSERINCFFRYRKTLISHFIFYVRESQDYTADDSSNRCFECSKMQFFEPVCESSHCRGEEWTVFDGWFSKFLGRQLTSKWLCFTQNWLFCVILVVRLRHLQLFRNASWTSNFCWIWLILKHPYRKLLFAVGLIRVNLQLITCHDVIDVFRSTAIVFFQHFFRQEQFFERLTNCVGSNANKFFCQ